MKYIKQQLTKDRIAWLALIFILILFAIIRYRLLDVPLERDEGEYAYAGQLIIEGVYPYQEVYNMKLPGIYAAYALLLLIFGQSHHGIHLGLLIINSITIIFVFLLAKKFINPFGAIMAGACFALFSVSPAVQGVHANAEHFVILFATAGLFVLLQAIENKSFKRLFAAGILLGLSFLMKQHGFAFSVFAVLLIVFDAFRQRIFQWNRLVLNLSSFVGGVALVIVFMCLILKWGGVFDNFRFWTIDYALTYISIVSFREAWNNFFDSVIPIILTAPLLWTLICYGFFALMTKRVAFYNKIFLLMYFFFSFLSLCPGLYFRPHYFVLILPCVSLFAGVTISSLKDFLTKFSSRKIYSGVPIFLIAISLAQPFWFQREFFFYMTPFQVSRMIYGLNPFPESIQVADFIKKHTTKQDCIAIFGSEPQIFFYSQRRSASPYIYMYPMMENQPFALKMQKEFIKSIETKIPKYIILIDVSTSWLISRNSCTEILKWINVQLQNKRIRLVGNIELFQDKSTFKWGPNANKPTSDFSIAIFESTKPS